LYRCHCGEGQLVILKHESSAVPVISNRFVPGVSPVLVTKNAGRTVGVFEIGRDVVLHLDVMVAASWQKPRTRAGMPSSQAITSRLSGIGLSGTPAAFAFTYARQPPLA